jgi:hypothetical protein
MDAPKRQAVLSARQQRLLVRLAACIVPETAGAPAQVTDALLSAIDEQLRPRPRLQQLEFKLLLLGLGGMTGLPSRWQERGLHLLENFPLRLVRVGIWGLKTLVFLGYYGQDSVERRIRYFPSKEAGNVRLRARQLPPEG